MSKASSRAWMIGVLIIGMCAVVLITGIDKVHMHADESLVYDFTRADLPYLVRYLAEQDSHPPLWFSSFWLWRQFVGEGEFAGRMLAVSYSLLTLAMVYQIGRRWFGAPRYGLFAMAVLGVNAYFFIYALEIRPYSLIMLLVTTSMWTFQRWQTRQTGRSAMWYAITIGLMLYVHYFLFVLMIVQALVFLLSRPTLRLIRQALHVVLMIFLIWLPWLPFAVYQVMHVRQAEMAGGNARGVVGAGTTTQATSVQSALSLARLATNGQVVLYAVMILIGLVLLWRRANYRLALAWGLGVPTMSMLINTLVAVYTPRYVVYMVVGLALIVGASLAYWPRIARWPMMIGVAALSLSALPTQLPHSRVPLRDLYQEVSIAAQPEDVIFFDDGDLSDGFVRGQIRRYLDPDLWARRVETQEEAISYRRIWYVTGYEWFLPETRERFGNIERTHPLQQIIGQCDRDWCYLLQLLEAPPFPQPELFSNIVAFQGVDIDALTEHSLATRLWWTANEALPRDYSISLQLLDSEGRLVAQSDGPIVDFYSGKSIQTSQLEPGRIYIDSRAITLPVNLPNGEYELVLVMYQSWDNTRLVLPDGSDHLRIAPLSVNNP